MSNYNAIPDLDGSEATDDMALRAMKENLEILTGQRGSRLASAVTWQDLVDLGLITADQVPS